MMSAAGAGRISAHRPPPTLLGGGKPDLIYYWHAARSHTAAISFRLVLRGASSGTATFPFWPGQTFFLFPSVIYIFAFALSLRLILFYQPTAQLPNHPTFWPSWCFAFAFCFGAPALGTWNLAALVPWQLPVYCVLCACLPKSGLFIYLCFARTNSEKKGHHGSTFLLVFSAQLEQLLQGLNLTLNSLVDWPKLR